MHTLIAGTDEQPHVDHRDHDGLNNQRFNLRPCSVVQNCANARKMPGKTSKLKGVHLCPCTGKWRADIIVNGVKHYLGRYYDENMAGLAYKLAAEKSFGEFAHA